MRTYHSHDRLLSLPRLWGQRRPQLLTQILCGIVLFALFLFFLHHSPGIDDAEEIGGESMVDNEVTSETKVEETKEETEKEGEKELHYPEDRSTFNEMPRSASQKKCYDDQDFGLVERWVQSGVDVCSKKGGSVLRCFRIGQFHHSGNGDTMCSAQNFLFDFNKANAGASGGESLESVMGQGESLEYLSYPKGSIQLQCEMDTKHFGGWPPQGYLSDVFRGIRNVDLVECGVRVDTPTVFVTRIEYANFYHAQSDLFNAFLSMMMANMNDPGVFPSVQSGEWQVVFLDAHPEGRVDGMWKTGLAPTHGYKYWSAYQKKKVCFSRAVFNIFGYSSPMCTDWDQPNPCGSSSLYSMYGKVFLKAYGLLETKPKHDVSVTLILREDYVAHPRDRGGGKRHNRISNEDELEEFLKSPSGDVSVRVVRLATIPLEEQVQIMRETNLLIGTHGAGLTWIPFLADEAAVIEMWPNHVKSKFHFRNLAKWCGKVYYRWENDDSIKEVNEYSTEIDFDSFRPIYEAALGVVRSFGSNDKSCGIEC